MAELLRFSIDICSDVVGAPGAAAVNSVIGASGGAVSNGASSREAATLANVGAFHNCWDARSFPVCIVPSHKARTAASAKALPIVDDASAADCTTIFAPASALASALAAFPPAAGSKCIVADLSGPGPPPNTNTIFDVRC